MKYSLLIITIIGFLINGCQTEVTCDTKILGKITQDNFFSDSTQAIILDCGMLDSVDIEITRTPFLTEIVEVEEFSNGKYDIKRFLADFQRFSKTDKYKSIRTTLIMQTKTYDASDWAADKEKLIRKYSLTQDDIKIFENIVKNPKNSSMNYPEAYQEMSRIKLQKLVDEMEKKKSENQ